MATTGLKAFPFSEDVTCPKCKHQTTLFDPEGGEFYVCDSCHSFIRFIANDTPVIQKSAPKISQQPVLKLGTTGSLNGYNFKVIAYLEKKEQNTHYKWREYILYSYEKGYATLAEYDGHWNFVAGKAFYPELDQLVGRTWDFVEYEGYEYSLFNKYTAIVTALTGEFDWDALHDRPKTSEYIAPPCMIFKEQDNKGASKADFYWGIYTRPAEVAAAFKLNVSDLPSKTGIGANEPSPYAIKWEAIWRVAPILLVLVAALGFISAYLRPERIVMKNNFYIIPDSGKVNEFKPFVTPAFTLSEPSSALDFTLTSAVDNNWLEATVVLINENTNQSWEVTESIEYYHGYEDGESWSEGSQSANILLSSIPQGKYHLNIYPASGELFGSSLDITVKTDPVVWRNFWVTVLLLAVYPAYVWLRSRMFEKKRWMNSDYSPFDTEE